MHRPSIGYALSGGAVRGAAHLGVLSVFEEAGIRPDAIAGTSAGSIVGAGYAAGLPIEQMAQMIRAATWREVTGLPRKLPMSVFDTTPLSAWVESAIGGIDFDELEIPLSTVACNITDGAKVMLRTGRVLDAAIASSAVPGLFAPVERDGMLLVDGGLVENLPVDTVRLMGVDVVIAVDVSPTFGVSRRPESIRDVMATSLTIMSRKTQIESRAKADFLVHPATDEVNQWDFRRVDQLIEAGREAATQVVPEVLAFLG